MFSLQEYQHVHLLWFKKRSFTSVWKPNPPLTFALVLTWRVKAQWARAAPALHTRRFCAASALYTHAVWNGRKPGSTEALALKAPLFTWSVKSFFCYNVLRLAVMKRQMYEADVLEQRRPCTRTSATTSNFYSLSKNGLEPCKSCLSVMA